MIKKFIFILSILALVVCCFAVTVSASEYFDCYYNNYDAEYSGYFELGTNSGDSYQEFTSSVEEEFGLFSVSGPKGAFIIGFINIEWWHTYFSSQNVTNDAVTFEDAVENLSEMGAIAEGLTIYSILISNTPQLHELYLNYVEELNTPTYEDGVEAGVSAYKNSYEYEEVIKAAKDEGKAQGVIDYMNSYEFAEALELEYERGKTEAESEEQKTASDILAVGLGVGFLAFIVIVAYSTFGKKKRRRR